MVASLQRWFLVLMVLWLLGWGALAWWTAQVWPLALGVVSLATGHAVVLLAEFVLLRFTARHGPSQYLPTVAQMAKAWWAEVLLAPVVFCWRQPFFVKAVPDHLPHGSGRRGVVLVHGLFCNRAFWNPMLLRLRSEGIPFVALNLEPMVADIGEYGPQVAAAMAQVQACTGQAPVVLAHSMGGLAVRHALHRSLQNGQRPPHRVITVGTPHHGTFMANFGRSISARQMRLGSPWLADLARDEPMARLRGFTCFYGHCDNVVFPLTVACLPHADNRHLPGVAHIQMAFQPQVWAELQRWLADPEDAPDQGDSATRRSGA